MNMIDARNVGDALPTGVQMLLATGVERDSRNGPVLLSKEPVTTRYDQPRERVIFWPERDANPYFHLMESLWMLGGRNDLAFLTRYVSTMSRYSDDGGRTQPGAYGHRWRRHFGRDQLDWVIKRLMADKDDRRSVIQMYDPNVDQPAADNGGRDIPCNVTAHLQILHDGTLGLTVFCRSNDMVWGAYGANAVHFSMMQEYVASSLGVPVGPYWQVSDNFHAYKTSLAPVSGLTMELEEPYELGLVAPYPIMTVDKKTWDQDLGIFLDQGPIVGFREPFFRKVVTPIENAHKAYRQTRGPERYEIPLEILEQCKATDWKRACQEWILRRKAAFERALDAGPDHGKDEDASQPAQAADNKAGTATR